MFFPANDFGANFMGDYILGFLEGGGIASFADTLLERTGAGAFVIVAVGVVIVGHLFRVLFSRGGLAEGVSAVTEHMPSVDTSGGWDKLEKRARKVNGWRG